MPATDRQPLTRSRIATAALVFIDDHGLDGLSMRKLGAELGVEAMSLYNHVDNKADLFNAVVDKLFGDVLEAYGHPSGDWKVHARALSHAYVDVAAAHPRAVRLLISPSTESNNAEEFNRRIIAAARLMTDDSRVGALAFATVANWVIGTIVEEHGLMHGPDWESATTTDALISDFLHASHALTADEKFNEGLETVLAGLEARYFSGNG